MSDTCVTPRGFIGVGAGFAGLTAVREVAKAGKSVYVVEARDRVGGRVWNHELPGGEQGERGAMYVGPTQNRIPPGGGPVEQWLADPRLDGGDFGTTGIELGADRRTLFVAVRSQAGGAGGNPSSGRLFTIPLQPDGKPGEMTELWESRPADGPDGFGIARSSNVYIALLASNQLAMIDPQGVEKERFPSAPGPGDNGSPVPFDAPSNASVLGTRVVVGNQSYFSGDRAHQAILDVESGEEGLPELIPPAPRADAPPPAAQPKRKWSCRRYTSRRKRRACRRTLARRRAAARKQRG